MEYNIITIRDNKGFTEEFSEGKTTSLREARKIAQAEAERIRRDKEPERVEIRVYADAEELDYDTVSIEDGSTLKAIREMRGLSQADLADMSGVKLQAIRHYEQGFRDFNGARAITVYQLAKALRCTVEDLLDL